MTAANVRKYNEFTAKFNRFELINAVIDEAVKNEITAADCILDVPWLLKNVTMQLRIDFNTNHKNIIRSINPEIFSIFI